MPKYLPFPTFPFISPHDIHPLATHCARNKHVGTHGPCVRARRMKHKCTIITVDARAVRPYMHSNSSFNQSFYTLIGYDTAQSPHKRSTCPPVYSSTDNPKTERTHEPCVPTCIRMEWSVAPVDNQRLIPCVPILAILQGNPCHFTAQYNPYCTVKWVRLERHRADFETSHANCWFSTPMLLRTSPMALYY